MDWVIDLFARYWPVLLILVGLVGLIWWWLEMQIEGIVFFLLFAGVGSLLFVYEPHQLVRYWPVLLIVIGLVWLWYGISGDLLPWAKQVSLVSGLYGLFIFAGVGVLLLFVPTRVWDWFRTRDLAISLVSEGIGILVTVMIIDRLIAWRERRRWRNVRELFLAQANNPCRKIINAWKDWLLVMSKVDRNNELSETDRLILLDLGYYALQGSHVKSGIEIYLGKPPGSRLDTFANSCDSRIIDEMTKSLVPYLATKLLPKQHDSWSKLYEEIASPVEKLSDLVDRYSMVVDPQFAGPVIRLSGDVENLKAGEYEKAAESGASGRIAAALTISHGIQQSLELKYYLREHN
jgi:hypothetical protein